jgi:hypothetical protein
MLRFWIINIPPLLGVVLWPFLAMISYFIFDPPGSEKSWLVWTLHYALLAYPVPTVAGVILSWKKCKNNEYKPCFLYTLLTYSCLLLIILLFSVI